MIERRRAARLLVLIVAGLAVAGTSQPAPTPGPTQRVELTGTVHVTADSPVIVQPIDIQVAAGELASLDFSATISKLPADGSIVVTIESVKGSAPRSAYAATPPPDGGAAASSVVAQASFPFACKQNPCIGAFALVVTWSGAPAGQAADLAWSLTTVAQFGAAFSSASQQPGQVVVSADGKATPPESAQLGSATSGKAVHLTETDRFRAWTVAFHRSGAAQGQSTERPISQASLVASVTQTAGPAFAAGSTKDRREEGRRDPPVQLRVFAPGDLRAVQWASDPALTFDPFVTCPETGPCDTEMTVELAWADGRTDTAFDAAFAIHFAVIGLSAKVEPIEAKVVAVAAADLATATASGAFEASRPTTRGQSVFVATVDPGTEASSPWARVGLPVRALITARVISTGTTPLPADALISVYGQGRQYTGGAGLGSSVELHPGQEATFAFEPMVICQADRPRACEVSGSIGSSIVSPGPNSAPDGIAIRVDWTLELGVVASTGNEVVIAVDPGPSASPRP